MSQRVAGPEAEPIIRYGLVFFHRLLQWLSVERKSGLDLYCGPIGLSYTHEAAAAKGEGGDQD